MPHARFQPLPEAVAQHPMRRRLSSTSASCAAPRYAWLRTTRPERHKQCFTLPIRLSPPLVVSPRAIARADERLSGHALDIPVHLEQVIIGHACTVLQHDLALLVFDRSREGVIRAV